MFEINKNVVFVQGLKNGAIYDFNSGDIFSINKESCNVLNKIIKTRVLTKGELEYAQMLKDTNLLGEAIKKYYPIEPNRELDLCWLEITQLCNCKCVHCYEGNTHFSSKQLLTVDDWKSVIDQLCCLGVKRVVVIGGEPCLYNYIETIVEYVSSKKIDTTIFTNGTCISNNLKEIILKQNIKMKFSLYGHCENVHDKITNLPGSFNKLVNNIEYFLKNDIDVTVAVVLMKENERFVNEIITFLKKIGVKKYRFDVIREVFGGTQNSHIPTIDNIKELAQRTCANFPKISKEKFDIAYYRNTCWNGKIVVSEDGNVLPCVFERNISLGNIKNSSIEEILYGEKTMECWNCTFDYIDECKDCEFRFACKDCRPLAFASGNKVGKNPRCTYNVARGEWD